MAPGRQLKFIFTQESFYLQGILNDINEQDTFFLDCKHKHMMKSGAPPDKFRVLHRLLPIHVDFHGFTKRIDFLRVITLYCLVLSQFLYMVWVHLNCFLETIEVDIKFPS